MYLLLFIVSFAASAYILLPTVLKYQAETTFYLANENLANPALFNEKKQDDILQVNLVQERIYQLAYSTEMMNFLIERFNLYQHYGIDSTREDHFARAVKEITQNIKFNKVSRDLSMVTVTDRNNELAATLANALVWKLDQMNRQYLIDKLQVNVNFYNSFVKESAKIGQVQNAKLKQSLESLGEYRGSVKSNEDFGKSLSEIEFEIYSAISKIQDLTTQQILAKNLYNNAVTTLTSGSFPNLIVIKKALPELKSKKLQLGIFATLASILVCVLVLITMYVYFSYRMEIWILFGKKLPEGMEFVTRKPGNSESTRKTTEG